MRVAVHHPAENDVFLAGVLDVFAGIWLLLSPFVIHFHNAPRAVETNVVCGIIVALLAAVRALAAPRQAWISWLNALVGLFVLLSPWALDFARAHAATTNNVAAGITIIALACWSAVTSSMKDDGRHSDIDESELQA